MKVFQSFTENVKYPVDNTVQVVVIVSCDSRKTVNILTLQLHNIIGTLIAARGCTSGAQQFKVSFKFKVIFRIAFGFVKVESSAPSTTVKCFDD